ncbi:hypothetical protein [Salipiger thiooxidans]|uniref:hypothetical protein n=1 Tax=Salipiger thiooxidans TaxID=282683 RepID=UPI001CD747B7|nr:hypothetical protein [Salipiger thiooxidans]MCA0846070.1 hypothetical protein [Salipiger thiooxidans]
MKSVWMPLGWYYLILAVPGFMAEGVIGSGIMICTATVCFATDSIIKAIKERE